MVYPRAVAFQDNNLHLACRPFYQEKMIFIRFCISFCLLEGAFGDAHWLPWIL